MHVCDAEQAQQATCSVTPIMRSQNMVQNRDRLFIDGVSVLVCHSLTQKGN